MSLSKSLDIVANIGKEVSKLEGFKLINTILKVNRKSCDNLEARAF